MSYQLDSGNVGARLASSAGGVAVRPASTAEAIGLVDARLAYLRELLSAGQAAALVEMRRLESIRADLQLFSVAEVAS